MTAVADRYESYVGAFEAFRREPAFGGGDAAAARETAFRRFLERGFPTTREEEWKFTNVGPIAAEPFVRAPNVPIAADAVAPFELAGTCAIVLVNGRFVPALSARSWPAGVTVHAAPIAGTDRSDARGDDLREGRDHGGIDPFAELNAAFADATLVIDIAPHAVVGETLHVLSVTVAGRQPALVTPRLVVRAGEAAQVSIIESYGTIGAAATFTAARTRIVVAPGALVDHVKLQCEGDAAFHVAGLVAHLGRASTFTSRALTFGGRIARNDIVALLDGEGAECTLHGLYVATGDRLVDTHTTIEHREPHCPSHEVYKGILAGRARAVFNGKIIVDRKAQKTDAKQTNRALLLSDDAQINTKPQLEIFADDVKCTHGAAVGQLDDDAMFYLRARGISEVEARRLLIGAFAGEVLNGVRQDAVRERAEGLIARTLGLSRQEAMAS